MMQYLHPITARSGVGALFVLLSVSTVTPGCGGSSADDYAAPDVAVYSPQPGLDFIEGQSIEICAAVSDADSSLASLTIRLWIDDQEIFVKEPGSSLTEAKTHCTFGEHTGNIGVELAYVSPGEHTLILEAIDNKGGDSRSETKFVVIGEADIPTPTPTATPATPTPETPTPILNPNIRPNCQILEPRQGDSTLEGAAIRFTASVNDVDDAREDLFVNWSSEPSSPAIDGRGGYASLESALSFTTEDIEPGAYSVFFTVVDPEDASFTCSVDINVDACPDEDDDGYTVCEGDCDDGNPDIHPDKEDLAGDGDEDCDDAIDEDAPTPAEDRDGDGYDGNVDCDDEDMDINPGAVEEINNKDEDCDGIVDEDTAASDDDQDGYSEAAGDCDDDNALIHPTAAEGPAVGDNHQADTLDNDCDGIVDEDTAQYDDDLDGYTEAQGDCNDANPDIVPGAYDDPFDAIDNDCDSVVDEDLPPEIDDDEDGYLEEDDCDDHNAEINPGAIEICDDIDNNCDGQVDEGQPDEDGDGIGGCYGDCDDDNATVYPGADESGSVGNGDGDHLDNDCDGQIDEGTNRFDDDGDGVTEDAGDCNDEDPNIYPGAEDLIGEGDENCDGIIDDAAVRIGDLVITEIRRKTYAEPDGLDAQDLQWFEVRNTTDREIRLDGWLLEIVNGHPAYGDYEVFTHLFPEDSPKVNPGGYLVIGNSEDPTKNGGVAVGTNYGEIELGFVGSLTLYLGGVDELQIDRVEWDDGFLYPIENGASLNLTPDAFDGNLPPHLVNDDHRNWCVSSSFYGRDLMGTPNSDNDLCF